MANAIKFPVYKYKLEVHTGDVPAADTDANVWVEVYGERGDTGRRKLLKSNTNTNKFEQGKVSIYSILQTKVSLILIHLWILVIDREKTSPVKAILVSLFPVFALGLYHNNVGESVHESVWATCPEILWMHCSPKY